MADPHISSQLAACERAAGLAVLPGAPVLELRAAEDELTELARLLAVAASGRAPWGWWRRVGAQHALALIDPAPRTGLGMMTHALANIAPDVFVTDASAAYVRLLLTGRRARALAAVAPIEPVFAVDDGDQCCQLIVAAEHAGTSRHALLQSGRGAGLIAVDPRVIELRRIARGQLHHPTVPAPTGALSL